MSITPICRTWCGLDYRGREKHYHPGTQKARRASRTFAHYYRRRDPWDFVARDKQLGITALHEEYGRIRAAEREYLRKEMSEC